MIRFSLVVLFAVSLATLTAAASVMPEPPEIRGMQAPAVVDLR